MVKKIFSIAIYSIRQRTTELRILFLFVLMITFLWNDLTVISDFAKMMNIKTNPLIFPFFSSDPVKQLILLSGVIFLFSDAPFINKSQPYVIIRSKRSSWVLGQILYVILASAVYFLILMCASILILLPNATFATDGWGKIINTLAQTNAGAQINLQFNIAEKITSFYSPLEAFGLSFLLNWSIASFLGLLMFIINLKFNRMLGLVVGATVLFLDLLAINILPYKFYHFSPVTLSRLAILDPTGVSIVPYITYPFVFFGVSIILFSVLLVAGIKNEPIEITSEM